MIDIDTIILVCAILLICCVAFVMLLAEIKTSVEAVKTQVTNDLSVVQHQVMVNVKQQVREVKEEIKDQVTIVKNDFEEVSGYAKYVVCLIGLYAVLKRFYRSSVDQAESLSSSAKQKYRDISEFCDLVIVCVVSYFYFNQGLLKGSQIYKQIQTGLQFFGTCLGAFAFIGKFFSDKDSLTDRVIAECNVVRSKFESLSSLDFVQGKTGSCSCKDGACHKCVACDPDWRSKDRTSPKIQEITACKKCVDGSCDDCSARILHAHNWCSVCEENHVDGESDKCSKCLKMAETLKTVNSNADQSEGVELKSQFSPPVQEDTRKMMLEASRSLIFMMVNSQIHSLNNREGKAGNIDKGCPHCHGNHRSSCPTAHLVGDCVQLPEYYSLNRMVSSIKHNLHIEMDRTLFHPKYKGNGTNYYKWLWQTKPDGDDDFDMLIYMKSMITRESSLFGLISESRSCLYLCYELIGKPEPCLQCSGQCPKSHCLYLKRREKEKIKFIFADIINWRWLPQASSVVIITMILFAVALFRTMSRNKLKICHYGSKCRTKDCQFYHPKDEKKEETSEGKKISLEPPLYVCVICKEESNFLIRGMCSQCNNAQVKFKCDICHKSCRGYFYDGLCAECWDTEFVCHCPNCINDPENSRNCSEGKKKSKQKKIAIKSKMATLKSKPVHVNYNPNNNPSSEVDEIDEWKDSRYREELDAQEQKNSDTYYSNEPPQEFFQQTHNEDYSEVKPRKRNQPKMTNVCKNTLAGVDCDDKDCSSWHPAGKRKICRDDNCHLGLYCTNFHPLAKVNADTIRKLTERTAKLESNYNNIYEILTEKTDDDSDHKGQIFNTQHVADEIKAYRQKKNKKEGKTVTWQVKNAVPQNEENFDKIIKDHLALCVPSKEKPAEGDDTVYKRKLVYSKKNSAQAESLLGGSQLVGISKVWEALGRVIVHFDDGNFNEQNAHYRQNKWFFNKHSLYGGNASITKFTLRNLKQGNIIETTYTPKMVKTCNTLDDDVYLPAQAGHNEGANITFHTYDPQRQGIGHQIMFMGLDSKMQGVCSFGKVDSTLVECQIYHEDDNSFNVREVKHTCPTVAGDCGGLLIDKFGTAFGFHVSGAKTHNGLIPFNSKFIAGLTTDLPILSTEKNL